MKLFPLVALALFAPAALASHDLDCTPTSATNAVEVGGFHVWVQPSGLDVFHASWGVWQETNGVSGLQRWDVVFDETCEGQIPADTEIIAFYAL